MSDLHEPPDDAGVDSGADLPPVTPDDELVSGYVDGAATPEEVGRVESDPGLLARADEFRAVSAAVGEVPAPPPADARDAAVAAALAGSAGVAAAGSAAPTELRVARAQRLARAKSHKRFQWVAVAAVLLLGAVVGARVLSKVDSDYGDDVAADVAADQGADDSNADAAGGAEADGSADAAGAAGSGATDSAAGDVGDRSVQFTAAAADLGEFDTLVDLSDAVQQRVLAPQPTSSTLADAPETAPRGADEACIERAMTADANLAAVVLSGHAVVAGEDVNAIVFSSGDDRHVLEVVGPAPDCALRQPLLFF